MSEYYAGLDLGQSRDFTALAIVEWTQLPGEWDAAAYAHRKVDAVRLRHLERVALGTPYPDVVARVAKVMRSPALAAGRRSLAADATGVGRPVADLLRRANLGCALWPVLITGGHTESSGQGFYHVPKRDLIIGLQVLLQRGELQIAAGLSHGEALVREMAEMRVRVTGEGREQYGVWREGEHDDLVLAVALACWGLRRVRREVGCGERTRRLL